MTNAAAAVVIVLMFVAWRIRMYLYHRRQAAALHSYIEDMRKLGEGMLRNRRDVEG